MQGELDAVVDDGVPGVVASLVANHVIVFSGEQVGDFALALIAPLRANNNRTRHVVSPLLERCVAARNCL